MIEINSRNSRVWSKLGQRGTVFGVAALELGATRDDLIIVTADLATLSGIDRFKNLYPEKFLNVGIAEQNMIGIASGMANEGQMVIATTYATFISMRSFEQVRHFLGYMKSNVKIIGSGAGLIMGMSGTTHYGIEDLALMCSIPGLIVLSPADAGEALKAIFAAAEYEGPVYIRLTGGLNCPIVYKEDYNFTIGKAVTLKEGSDITIIATGTMVYEAHAAAKILEEREISATLVNMHTIKPLDTTAIDRACALSRLIVTVEEHSAIGGLGAAVAEYKTSIANAPRQLIIGLPDYFSKAGDYGYLLEKYSLTGEKIAQRIISML